MDDAEFLMRVGRLPSDEGTRHVGGFGRSAFPLLRRVLPRRRRNNRILEEGSVPS